MTFERWFSSPVSWRAPIAWRASRLLTATLAFGLLLSGLLSAVGCTPAPQQRLAYGLYASPAMQRDMTYSVYTPPGWSASEQLPLVVLLHGAADDPKTPDKSQVGQVLDAHIAKGDVPRVVIAVPQGDLGFWENWASGERRYRDWVTQELVPTCSGVITRSRARRVAT